MSIWKCLLLYIIQKIISVNINVRPRPHSGPITCWLWLSCVCFSPSWKEEPRIRGSHSFNLEAAEQEQANTDTHSNWLLRIIQKLKGIPRLWGEDKRTADPQARTQFSENSVKKNPWDTRWWLHLCLRRGEFTRCILVKVVKIKKKYSGNSIDYTHLHKKNVGKTGSGLYRSKKCFL